jgi:hypothetical protein
MTDLERIANPPSASLDRNLRSPVGFHKIVGREDPTPRHLPLVAGVIMPTAAIVKDDAGLAR